MSSNPDLSGYKPNYDLTHEDIFGPKIPVARREVVFMDEDGNIVDRDSGKATRFAAVEYDAEDNVISESFGVIGNPGNATKQTRTEVPKAKKTQASESAPTTKLKAYLKRLDHDLRFWNS